MRVHQIELYHFHPPDGGRMIELGHELVPGARGEDVPFLFLSGPEIKTRLYDGLITV